MSPSASVSFDNTSPVWSPWSLLLSVSAAIAKPPVKGDVE